MMLHFLNVDLDLVTTEKPVAIIRSFGGDAMLLASHRTDAGTWSTCFEVNAASRNPAQALAGFKRLLAQLTPRAKAEWERATKREFDFGYDTIRRGRITRIAVPPQFVAFAARVNASIKITVYDDQQAYSQLQNP